jgi:hypothetical protein
MTCRCPVLHLFVLLPLIKDDGSPSHTSPTVELVEVIEEGMGAAGDMIRGLCPKSFKRALTDLGNWIRYTL